MALYNLADKFVNLVDERFKAEAFATSMCGANYSFDGVDQIKIPSMGTVPMNDYDRHGLAVAAGTRNSRYGDPIDLQASVQKMTMGRDRSFSFIVEKADKLQSQSIIEANSALSRQIDEVIIPEYDRYVFNKLASTACAVGNYSKLRGFKSNASKATSASASDGVAYNLFTEANEFLADHFVPDQGRVAICSPSMVSALKQDKNFVLASDCGMDIKMRGFKGTVDDVTIIQVPNSRLPKGCGALVSHPYASVAPEQIKEYKIHDDPPGISGWLVEGRLLYDCFVLNSKLNALYYIGLDGVSRNISIITTPEYATGYAASATKTAMLQIQDYEASYVDFATGAAHNYDYYYRICTTIDQPDYDHTSTNKFNASAAAVSGVRTAWTKITTGAVATGLSLPAAMGGAERVFVEVAQIDANGDTAGYGTTILNLYDEI